LHINYLDKCYSSKEHLKKNGQPKNKELNNLRLEKFFGDIEKPIWYLKSKNNPYQDHKLLP